MARRTELRYPEAQRVAYARTHRARGASYKAIGAQIGMTANGVMQMLRRVDDPERYYGHREDGEVDRLIPDVEDW